MASIIMNCPPAALERDQAAAYVSLGISTFTRLVQSREAPQPRQFPARRVCWLRAELDAWLLTLPQSDLLPPENTGAPKPRKLKPAQASSPNA